MLLFTGVIASYLIILLVLLQFAALHSITLVSLLMICVTAILYTKLLYFLPRRGRVVVNSIFIFFVFFLSFGNIIYYYIKDSFFTISQLSLLNELAGVSDTASGYFRWSYVIFLIIPIIYLIISPKLLNKQDKLFSNKLLLSAVVVLGLVNVSYYVEDSLLYTTIYNPVDYAKEFGFISFYAREITPFTKGELENTDLGNKVTDYPDNDYTGMFEDKSNVVFVTAESFDNIAIDQKLTPTLYKMANDGMFFENYYTLTTNTNASEFSILTSVHPPLDYSKVENYHGDYTSIPDLFNSADYCTFGFHLNAGDYYSRDKMYPNLYNFDYSYFKEDMDPEVTMNDGRDELLFEDSVEYIEQQNCDKNFTYYMSMFGHAAYAEGSKPTASEDYEQVKSVYPNNDQYLNSYLAYNMSLDQMFSEMIDYYTEQGIIDDTLFIVVADHYPYAIGNQEQQIGEYSKQFVKQSFSGEPYESYNVPLFIYDPSQKLDDNTEYMSNIDILPTVADLFGFDYQYAEGKSAFDTSRPGVIKWLAYEDYAMLSEDAVYTGDPEELEANPTLAEQVDQDKLFSAKLYSLFD